MLSLLPLPSWCWTSSDQFLKVYFIQLFYFLWECWFRTSFPMIATHLWFKIFCRWNKVWFLIVGKEIIWSHEINPKKNFIFIKNFIEQHSHCFVLLSSAIFRQLQDSIFPKLLIFLSKELFQVPFTVFQGIDIFFIKIICKDWNKWKSEDTLSGEYGVWIKTSEPSCNSCCLVSKETCSLTLFLWMCFLLTNSGCFSWSAA